MLRVAAPSPHAHSRASPVEVETPWNTSSTASGTCVASSDGLAANPSLARTTACARTSVGSPFWSTTTPTTRPASLRRPMPGVLSTKATPSLAAIAARSVRTERARPTRAGSVCSRGAVMPCRRMSPPSVKGMAELVVEPLEDPRRDLAHGLHERAGRLVAALAHDVVDLALRRVVDAGGGSASGCRPPRGCRSTPGCCTRAASTSRTRRPRAPHARPAAPRPFRTHRRRSPRRRHRVTPPSVLQRPVERPRRLDRLGGWLRVVEPRPR